MALRAFLFTQTGCLSCELMKLFLEAKGFVFEERDMSSDAAARSELLETYHCRTAPTLVIFTPAGVEVIEGFEPGRLDRVLDAA
jgi:glutaredoxin 3